MVSLANCSCPCAKRICHLKPHLNDITKCNQYDVKFININHQKLHFFVLAYLFIWMLVLLSSFKTPWTNTLQFYIHVIYTSDPISIKFQINERRTSKSKHWEAMLCSTIKYNQVQLYSRTIAIFFPLI